MKCLNLSSSSRLAAKEKFGINSFFETIKEEWPSNCKNVNFVKKPRLEALGCLFHLDISVSLNDSDNLTIGCRELRRARIFPLEQKSRYWSYSVLNWLNARLGTYGYGEHTRPRRVVEYALVRETTLIPKRDLYNAQVSYARPLFHDFPVAPQIIALTITCRLRCELSKLIRGVIAFAPGSPRRIKGEIRGREGTERTIAFSQVSAICTRTSYEFAICARKCRQSFARGVALIFIRMSMLFLNKYVRHKNFNITSVLWCNAIVYFISDEVAFCHGTLSGYFRMDDNISVVMRT